MEFEPPDYSNLDKVLVTTNIIMYNVLYVLIFIVCTAGLISSYSYLDVVGALYKLSTTTPSELRSEPLDYSAPTTFRLSST